MRVLGACLNVFFSNGSKRSEHGQLDRCWDVSIQCQESNVTQPKTNLSALEVNTPCFNLFRNPQWNQLFVQNGSDFAPASEFHRRFLPNGYNLVFDMEQFTCFFRDLLLYTFILFPKALSVLRSPGFWSFCTFGVGNIQRNFAKFTSGIRFLIFFPISKFHNISP